MDFFHCPIKIISRNKGRSAVAASAYISALQLENTWDGTTHDYTRKQHVIYTEVMLPAHAPPEYAGRSVLWNSVEWNEKKRDAQLARTLEMALPTELTHDQNIALIRIFVQETFVDTIRPVMDLTNIQNGVSAINGMFNPNSMQAIGLFREMNLSRGINQLNLDSGRITGSFTDKNIVSNLEGLQTKIEELGEAVTNMKLVLDTGALVGGTSAKMDNELETLAMRRGRGN